MSRRRGEFEHRTSIFEGAFRAWSHLGGLNPGDIETRTSQELDPLDYPIENDPRLKTSDKKRKKAGKDGDGGSGGGGSEDEGEAGRYGDGGIDEESYGTGGSGVGVGKRRDYPYEALPRSGLAHPFVQAILSPWLGPDADQDAIQLGLTTLRTWWQHRRKGESGSAVAALGTEKMRGVVEGYTRHFFNLAHCLVSTDREQPPRTLMQKMKDLDKERSKRSKKRAREEEAGKRARAWVAEVEREIESERRRKAERSRREEVTDLRERAAVQRMQAKLKAMAVEEEAKRREMELKDEAERREREKRENAERTVREKNETAEMRAKEWIANAARGIGLEEELNEEYESETSIVEEEKDDSLLE